MSAPVTIPDALLPEIRAMVEQVIAWYLRRTRGVTSADLSGGAWVATMQAYRAYTALPPERQTSPAAAYCRTAVSRAVRNEIVALLSAYRYGSARARKVLDGVTRAEYEDERTAGVMDPEDVLVTRRAAARALALVERYPLAERVLARGEKPAEVARSLGAPIESVYRETAEARRAVRADRFLACYRPHATL